MRAAAQQPLDIGELSIGARMSADAIGRAHVELDSVGLIPVDDDDRVQVATLTYAGRQHLAARVAVNAGGLRLLLRGEHRRRRVGEVEQVPVAGDQVVRVGGACERIR